ncbi:MAG TPA: hypothetical protein VEH77_00660, partial [Roseiarcus sp.]|nr:hypothetical protein [Roseiarcus sp.]
MNFIQLVMTVCALAQPATCEERRETFSTDTVSIVGCMIGAQPYIAKWSGEHPTLRVTRWRCTLSGVDGKKI